MAFFRMRTTFEIAVKDILVPSQLFQAELGTIKGLTDPALQIQEMSMTAKVRAVFTPGGKVVRIGNELQKLQLAFCREVNKRITVTGNAFPVHVSQAGEESPPRL